MKSYKDLKNQLDKKITDHQQALDISRQEHNKQQQQFHLHHLGVLHNELGKLNEAIDYFEEALTIARQIADKEGQKNHLKNLSLIYIRRQELDKVLELGEQILMLAQELDDKEWQADSLMSLALILSSQKIQDFDASQVCFQQALDIYTDIQSPRARDAQMLLKNIIRHQAELKKT